MAPKIQNNSVIWNQAVALVFNLWSWILSFLPRYSSTVSLPEVGSDRSVQIDGPGGFDRLRIVPQNGRLTVGYNVTGFEAPYTRAGADSSIPADAVVLCNQVPSSFFLK